MTFTPVDLDLSRFCSERNLRDKYLELCDAGDEKALLEQVIIDTEWVFKGSSLLEIAILRYIEGHLFRVVKSA